MKLLTEYDKHFVNHSLPLNFKKELEIHGYKYREFRTAGVAVQVFSFENVYLLYSSKGAKLLDSNYNVISEFNDSFLTDTDILTKNELIRKIKSEYIKVDGLTVSSIPFKAKGNFSHFLLEGIPRLGLCIEAVVNHEDIDIILIDDNFRDKISDVINTIGLPEKIKLVGIKDRGILKFDKLIVTNSLKHPAHNAHPAVLPFFDI